MHNNIHSYFPQMPLFQTVVCHVIHQAQTAFPNKVDISCTHIAHQLINKARFSELSPLDLTIEVNATIDWLAKAELLWFGGHELNDYFDVTLSKQALAKLLCDVDGTHLAELLAKAHSDEQQLKFVQQFIS